MTSRKLHGGTKMIFTEACKSGAEEYASQTSGNSLKVVERIVIKRRFRSV